MNRREFLRAGAALAAVPLVGCATPVATPRFADIGFSHRLPIRLDVAAIEVVERFEPPLREPHVEHLMPTPPPAAMRTWADDRLVAAGGDGRAVYEILDARTVEVPLKTKGGFKGLFHNEQAQRFDLRLEARLTVHKPGYTVPASAVAEASRSTTVAEDASPNDRARAWFALVDAAMKDFDAAMSDAVSRHLGHFVA